jgi:hypothetical protein
MQYLSGRLGLFAPSAPRMRSQRSAWQIAAAKRHAEPPYAAKRSPVMSALELAPAEQGE